MTTRCPASTPHVSTIEAISTVSMDVRTWEKWNCVPRSTDRPDPVASPDQRPGHLILVGDQLLILTVDGKLCLAPASPKALTRWPRRSCRLTSHRALPAFAQGRLLFRDNDTNTQNGKLYCLELVPQNGSPATDPEGR